MTVSDFWNHAFLAALSRVEPESARREADLALRLAISHWQKAPTTLMPTWTRYANFELADFHGHTAPDDQGAGAPTSE